MSISRRKRHLEPNQKRHICFVALNAYNVLSGRSDLNHTGGAEVQQVQIAAWLLKKGYAVSFVTLDHGQPDGIEFEGIKVFKAYAAENGLQGLRFVHPRWTGLWLAMKRANADVYYHRGAECETGQVGLWCRLHRRYFIFAAANDSDCDSSLYALTSRREKALYRLGLRLADAVTAQTETQRRMLRENMGVSACLVRNCGSNSSVVAVPEQPVTIRSITKRVLWVGRFSKQKRLEWLLDIAELCPEISFDVLGAANTESGYASSLINRASGIANVRMYGLVPHAEMAQHYQNCHILCCTSAYEGFPNTFLEAWSLGIPVISTFDPDGVIATKGLGWVVHDVEGIVACLKRINQSPEILGEPSKAARSYYLENHTLEVCLPELERLLLRVAGCKNKPV